MTILTLLSGSHCIQRTKLGTPNSNVSKLLTVRGREDWKTVWGRFGSPMGTPQIGKMRFGSCVGEVAFPPSLNTEMDQHGTDQKVDFGPFPSFFKNYRKSIKSCMRNIFDPFPLYLHLFCFPFYLSVSAF